MRSDDEKAEPVHVQPNSRRLGNPFWTLCTAAGLSATGTGITSAALPLLVLVIVGDGANAAALGVVAAAAQLPALLFALPSGILADRYDRRSIMLGADLARAVCLFIFGVLVVIDAVSIWTIVAVAFVLGAGEALFSGAAQPLLPALVDVKHLDTANGRLTTATDVGAEFVGPPVGSAVFALTRSLPFFADAATYLVSGLLVSRLPPTARADRPVDRPRLAPAITMTRTSPTLRSLWFALLILALCNSVVTTLTVLVLRDRVGLDERWFGVALAVIAAGAVAAGIGSGRLTRRWGGRGVLVASIIANAASYVVFGSATNIVVSFAALVVWGFSVTTGVIIAMSIRQRLTGDAIRGRVMSLFRFAIGIGGVIGALTAGAVTSGLGLTGTIASAAAVQLVAAAVVVGGVHDVGLDPVDIEHSRSG